MVARALTPVKDQNPIVVDIDVSEAQVGTDLLAQADREVDGGLDGSRPVEDPEQAIDDVEGVDAISHR